MRRCKLQVTGCIGEPLCGSALLNCDFQELQVSSCMLQESYKLQVAGVNLNMDRTL